MQGMCGVPLKPLIFTFTGLLFTSPNPHRILTAPYCSFLVLHATDVRASHLGFSLAPFRGLSRLQFLHTKEQVARRASEAEQTTRGTLEDLELHLYYNAVYAIWILDALFRT